MGPRPGNELAPRGEGRSRNHGVEGGRRDDDGWARPAGDLGHMDRAGGEGWWLGWDGGGQGEQLFRSCPGKLPPGPTRQSSIPWACYRIRSRTSRGNERRGDFIFANETVIKASSTQGPGPRGRWAKREACLRPSRWPAWAMARIFTGATGFCIGGVPPPTRRGGAG